MVHGSMEKWKRKEKSEKAKTGPKDAFSSRSYLICIAGHVPSPPPSSSSSSSSPSSPPSSSDDEDVELEPLQSDHSPVTHVG